MEVSRMTKPSTCWEVAAALLFCAVSAVFSPAQTFNTLVHFNGNDGYYPTMSLTQGVDGKFYGTTEYGGHYCPGPSKSCGTVFKIGAQGALTQLHRFVGTDGSFPMAGLVQVTDGNFYGTTLRGGTTGDGTVFQITPQGTLTTLYNFCPQDPVCTDGSVPATGLVQATNGNLYGTTTYGHGHNAAGTVFKITLAGVLTTLHTFDLTDGAYPEGALIQANDGNLYGTTYEGGSNRACGLSFGCGTVFRITPGGVLTTLYSFCAQTNCADGAGPQAALVQATDGNFYGTTFYGGANDTCDLGCGTILRITPAGVLTTLYSFCAQTNCLDGSAPEAGLVQATDGNFYGTTVSGGNMDAGTIFQITPDGALTTLYSFCSQPYCADGWGPVGGMIQATDGNFYGTTASNGGTVFSLSVGLGPFVKTLPAAGKAGTRVGILGTALTGATSVTFNGIPAQFSVPLPSLILAHVPPGATTGYVTVVTPSGTLTSNVPFHVIP
jgi:uncharacterized repeat protein (TIGR03803 family)